MEKLPQFLTVEQLARRLNRSQQSIYRGIAAGDIPVVRLNRWSIRIPTLYVTELERSAMAALVDATAR